MSDIYAGLNLALPVFSQLPRGIYMAFMDPEVEDSFGAFTEDGARFCARPDLTCLNPSHTGVLPSRDSLDAIATLEPKLARCRVFQLNLQHRLKDIPLRTTPDHNMIHWGGHQGNTHHAYLLGPLFHQSDIDIIGQEANSITPRLRTHVHLQESHGRLLPSPNGY